MATFGTNTIPSTQINVQSGGSYAVSAAFANTMGLVGGMDTANGTATEGETVRVSSLSDAADLFGEESELYRQVALAINNDAATVYACPVTETTVTESFSSVASGTLSDIPFDPNVQPEHDITAQDTTESASVTVNVVYDSPPSTPTDSNTINLNPVTGEWEADASSSYDISYAYGDYTSAISDLLVKVPRFATVLTENTSIGNTLATELSNYAQDFDFMHGVIGAMPEVETSSYSDNFDDRRLVVVAPSRAYTDSANTEMVRTMGAVGGHQASMPLGDSTTYTALNGFADLNTKYGNTELGELIDNQVLPLKQGGGIKVIKDMTTSTDARFERIYTSEIVDECTEISHQISQNYIGESNTEGNRFALEEDHSSSYAEMEGDNLLDDFDVNATEGADPNVANVDIALDVVDVMDNINVDITVGDIIRNNGAS